MTTEAPKTIIDVRTIAPRDRHPLIFGTFASLAPDEALLLINERTGSGLAK
jgi:uncharacterized protein (DUF2249 family)